MGFYLISLSFFGSSLVFVYFCSAKCKANKKIETYYIIL